MSEARPAADLSLLERRVQHLREQAFASAELGRRRQLLAQLVEAEKELAALPPAVPSQPIVRRLLPAVPSAPPLDTTVRSMSDSVRGLSGAPRGGSDNTRGAATTGLSVEVSLRMAHVPTGLIHLLSPDSHPLLTYRVRNHRHSPARLRFTSVVQGYSAQAVDLLEVPPGGQEELHHLPAFFLAKTREVTEICRAALHVQVDDLATGGQVEVQRTIPLWLLARTSAYLSILDPETGAATDLSPYLGAWVTPNQPEILGLLRRAAEHAPGRALSSYQVDAQGVEAQVAAIYKALQELDIAYINSVLTMGAVPGLLMQRVRLPRQSLAERAANCLDAAVLMASLLEAASLHPALVLIPGHAFLAWQTAAQAGPADCWDYVETTQLGGSPFAEAQALGRLTVEQYAPPFAACGSRNGPLFRRLPVAELRRQCILPME